MSEVKHPRALAIAKKGEGCLWDMGDYLIEVAGKPSTVGGRDGSNARLQEVADELMVHGYPQYSINFAVRLRRLAHAFPAKVRQANFASWSTHEEAGTPEMLEAVIAAAKAGGLKGVPKRFVRSVVKGIDADERAERKGKQIKAEKAAARAEAAGDTEKAKEKRIEARKHKGAPKPDKSKREAPKADDIPLAVVKAKFMADASDISAALRRMDHDISPHIDDLSKVFIVGTVEELLQIAETVRKLADKLNRNQINKRGHIHAVA